MAMMRLRREDPRVVGSFRLHRRLGAGGMGVVYLGSDRRGQRVALKLIRAELAEDPEFRTRFAREVSAASRIRGGCTARLVAADIDADRPWLATQYVPGPSLYDKVGEEGALPVSEVAGIGAALAEGLVAVHEAGVVHRDLKPSNILLSPKGPRIIDFGIAWATGASTLTHVGTAVGSPGFLAPEQVRGAAVTPATDVFALGATLAYAATADSPFGHGSSEVMLYRVVHEEPDLRGVPDALTLLIASCLAKDPKERPSTASLHERLGEIHAREARGLDPVRGFPLPQLRPPGRAAADHLRQRTQDRRGDPPPTRASSAGRPGPRRGPRTEPGGRTAPDGRAGQDPRAESGHRTGPGSRAGHGGRTGQGARAEQGPRTGQGARTGPNSRAGQGSRAGSDARGGPAARPDRSSRAGQGPRGSGSRPRTGAGRRPAPAGRPPGRGLLRQRLVVFVTVTLLAALGIAVAQGCQGPGSDGGLGPAPAPTGGSPQGNVAPPARTGHQGAAAALVLDRPRTKAPEVDWRNHRYADPAGGSPLRLRDGRMRGSEGDRVTLDRTLPTGYRGRPAQVVVLTRGAGPVREHLVELFSFRAGEPVLAASHAIPATPGAEYRWRIEGGALVREQRPPRGTAGGVRVTTYTALADGTFEERTTESPS